MPNVQQALSTSPGGTRWSLDTTGQVVLGSGHDKGVTTWALTIIVGGTASLTLRARARGTTTTDLALASSPAIGYRTTGSSSEVTTAITATTTLWVRGDGLDLVLDYTHTSGAATIVVAVPVQG